MPRMVWWVLVIHLPIVNLVFFPSPSRKNEKYKKRGKKTGALCRKLNYSHHVAEGLH